MDMFIDSLLRLFCMVSPLRGVAPSPPLRLGGTYLLGCPPAVAAAGCCACRCSAAKEEDKKL